MTNEIPFDDQSPAQTGHDAADHHQVAPFEFQNLLPEITKALIARRQLAMFTFLGMTTCLLLLLLVLPKTYLSVAKLYVKIGRESVSLDPTATLGQTFSINETRENEINSVLEILNSETIFDEVVKRLGTDVILEDATLDDQQLITAAIPGDYHLTESQPDVTHNFNADHRKAVRKLQEDISLSTVKRSSVIHANCKAKSPELAKIILDTFLDAAVVAHIKSNRTTGSFEFFDEQYKLVEKEFNLAAQKLSDKKNLVSVGSLDERQKNLQKLHSELELSIHTTSASLAAARSGVDKMDSLLTEMPNQVTTNDISGFPNDALGTTELKLYSIDLELSDLLTRFSENHPKVIKLQNERERATTLLGSNDPTRSQATRGINPVFVQLSQKRAELAAEMFSLESRVAELKNQQSQVSAKLEELNSLQGELTELQQRYDVLKDSLTDYSKKREQARVDMALEHERISNINIYQPATYNDKSVSASRKVILMFGMIFAAGVSILIAIGIELGPRFVSLWREKFSPAITT